VCVTLLNPPAHPHDTLVPGITPKAGMDRLAVAMKPKNNTWAAWKRRTRKGPIVTPRPHLPQTATATVLSQACWTSTHTQQPNSAPLHSFLLFQWRSNPCSMPTFTECLAERPIRQHHRENEKNSGVATGTGAVTVRWRTALIQALRNVVVLAQMALLCVGVRM
jgi:hypothetical protein